MLKSTSEAIDQAMSQLWEAKVKLVHVSFSIGNKLIDHPKTSHEINLGRNIKNATFNVEDLASKSMSLNDTIPEWISINLSAIPGINMEDVEDPEPSRPREHRRVPSTIAIEEVKVGL